MFPTSTPRPDRVPLLTEGGFISLKSWILRLSLHAEVPSSADLAQSRAIWDAERRKIEAACWPGIWEALRFGEIAAFSDLDGFTKFAIPVASWGDVLKSAPPEAVFDGYRAAPVAPLFRVGELEWLLPYRVGDDIWTPDQALMWLCTRDREIVDRASPAKGSSRLSWRQFIDQRKFPVMKPADAQTALKIDVERLRLAAHSAFFRLSPNVAVNCEWHCPSDDPAPFCTFKERNGELHGFVLERAEIEAAYPQPSEPTIDEPLPQQDTIETQQFTVAGLPDRKAKEAAFKDRVRQQAADYIASGFEPSKRPTARWTKRVGTEFGISNPNAMSLQGEVRDEFPEIGWKDTGRPPASRA